LGNIDLAVISVKLMLVLIVGVLLYNVIGGSIAFLYIDLLFDLLLCDGGCVVCG